MPINNIFKLVSTLSGYNMNNGTWILIKNNPICDKNLFIILLFKFSQVKYSTSCIELNARKCKKSKKLIILLK